jgi:acetyltransferase-like isoleucine patch superfamily enzyme
MPLILANILAKLRKDPRKCLNIFIAFVRGTYYIILYRIISNKISIAFPFFSYSSVNISGPGNVFIGRSTRVLRNTYKGLTIITTSCESKVIIGERCSLGGLTIRCGGRVSLGEKVMTAFSLIQDTYYNNLNEIFYGQNNLHNNKDIVIGNNVWLSGQSIVLGGCKIGNDSVLSFGACCHDMEVGEYMLLAGNPVKRPIPIDNVLHFMGIK